MVGIVFFFFENKVLCIKSRDVFMCDFNALYGNVGYLKRKKYQWLLPGSQGLK
jgi:hypothetical protein